jgi:hypothetical protein
MVGESSPFLPLLLICLINSNWSFARFDVRSSFLATPSLQSVDGGSIEIEVRDEITGESLSPERAHFVRGRTDAFPPYDGVHVFGDWAKALAQQAALGGEIIGNPFKR